MEDRFRLAYQQAEGDVALLALVVSHDSSEAWSKAGLMIRESLEADSPHVHVLLSASSDAAARFEHRRGTGATTTGSDGTVSAAPRWLKIRRHGARFAGYESPDGEMWSLIGTQVIAMADTVYVGLSLAGADGSTESSAVFDQWEIDHDTTNPMEDPAIIRYASVTGSGAHDGTTPDDAWTLPEAFASATAGATVYVEAGNCGPLNLDTSHSGTGAKRTRTTPATAPTT
jgi:hypothetical protein